MSIIETVIYIAIITAIGGWAFYKERHYEPGNPPLVPYTYIQLTAMICLLVLCAHLFSTTTGITWDPPRRN